MIGRLFQLLPCASRPPGPVARLLGAAAVCLALSAPASPAQDEDDPFFGFGSTQAVAVSVAPGDDEWGEAFDEWGFPADVDRAVAEEAPGAPPEDPPPYPSAAEFRAECRKETRRFAALIAKADSLSVEDMRAYWSDAFIPDAAYETTDPAEIAEFNALFQFDAHDEPGFVHLCAGHPGVTWRRKGKVLVHVSIGHGESVRWDGFGYWIGDVPLTAESRSRLAEWFLRRGIRVEEEWHLGEPPGFLPPEALPEP